VVEKRGVPAQFIPTICKCVSVWWRERQLECGWGEGCGPETLGHPVKENVCLSRTDSVTNKVRKMSANCIVSNKAYNMTVETYNAANRVHKLSANCIVSNKAQKISIQTDNAANKTHKLSVTIAFPILVAISPLLMPLLRQITLNAVQTCSRLHSAWRNDFSRGPSKSWNLAVTVRTAWLGPWELSVSNSQLYVAGQNEWQVIQYFFQCLSPLLDRNVPKYIGIFCVFFSV
jgi:hypothetical protein